MTRTISYQHPRAPHTYPIASLQLGVFVSTSIARLLHKHIFIHPSPSISAIMGANQSKTPLPNEKLIIERLRALEINNDDYVEVDEKALAGSRKAFKAPWTALLASDVEQWEHELLQDPKNRSAPIHCPRSNK